MTCKNCGSEIKSGARFCTNCGAPAEQQPVAQSVSDIATESAQHSFDVTGEIPSEQMDVHETAAANAQTAADTSKKKKLVMIASAAAIAVIAVVALVLAITSMTAANDLKQAIDAKDAYQVNSVYNAARGDSSKMEKYDQVIADTIESMQSDLNAHDFDTAALSDAGSAVTDYASSQWGTLMYNPDGETLSGSVSSANEPAWEGLTTLYDSKINYCDGLYAYKTSGDYESAISSFTGVTEADSKFDDTATMIGECADAYIGATLTAVEEKIAEGDINGGLQLLNAAEAYLDECGLSSGETAQQLTAKIEETLASYADIYAQKAEACFNEKDVDGAIGNMEVAMELQPDNADYKTKYDTYQQYLPFNLYDEDNVIAVEDIDASWAHFDTHATANDNTEMLHVISVGHDSYETTNVYNIQYNLAGKYGTVNGKMFIADTYKNTVQTSYFEAYGDGKLLYTSPKMEKGVLPQDVSFDVTGVQKLELKFYTRTDSTIWSSEVCVSNLVAQKAFPTE
ncbi:MAG: NPCBM/NEW2 domain-containing protein [Clostridiales bacterium]|nr:NPCBM/NEW2 domain-containing protein [Clostridiales bacterium]